MLSPDQLRANLEAVSERVARAAVIASPILIAVSKTQPAEAVRALYGLGHRDFGENYAQELVEKAEKLAEWGCTDLRWHFIGHLQSNKAKMLAPWVRSVHALTSLSAAQGLGKRWIAAGRTGALEVFIEVNIDGEATKSGVSPKAAPALAAQIASVPGLALAGLMCIPAARADFVALRGAFARMRELESRCRPHTAGALSMGMSSDFELALGEGATHVRVGTAIFGARG